MKHLLKVVVIGGGSSYTPELIEGIIKRYDTFPVTDLVLVDVELGKDKVKIIEGLTKRQIEKAGLPITVSSTLNRREALKDADFVLTQLRVGGLQARSLDELIPAKYGIIGQETNGPGGMFKALRTIPVILDIINDCKELCPVAWIINFTNPAGIVTQAVSEYSDWNKFIGLCNIPFDTKNQIAKATQNELSDVEIEMIGLNHMVFANKIKIKGQDVKEELLHKVANGEFEGVKNIYQLPWDKEILLGLESIPCDYLRYYFTNDEMLEHQDEQVKTGTTRAQQVIKIEEELFKKYQDVHLDVKPKELEQRGGAYYSDAACNLINSIYNDYQDIQVVDTINNGTLSWLKDNDAIEVSCKITKDGPIPIEVEEPSDVVFGLVSQLKAFERLVAKASVTGDYNTALLAMVYNPLVQSQKKGRIILDELLEAHKDYLPQFNK